MHSTVSGDLDQFGTAIHYQLRFFYRSSRFLGVVGFFAAIGVIILLVTVYRGADPARTGTDQATYMQDVLFFFAAFFVPLSAAIFGGDAGSMDTGSAAGYYTLPLPVRREVLLLGRFVAAAIVAFATVMVYYALFLITTLYVWGTLPWEVLVSISWIGLACLGYLGLAFFFSSLFRTPLISLIGTILLVVIGLPIAEGIVTGAVPSITNPWYFINYSSGIIRSCFTQGLSSYWQQVVGLLLYFVGFLSVAVALFHYREIQA